MSENQIWPCHSQDADGEIKDFIEKHGHFILQMEGCPEPH